MRRHIARLLLLTACLLPGVSATAQAGVVYYLAAAPEADVRAAAQDPDRLAHFLFARGEGKLTLDKTWQGLHWLLARSAGMTSAPASHVLLGGAGIGKALGLGSAHCHPPAEVRRIAALLATISEDELRKRYDAKAMDAAHVYPEQWVEWQRRGEPGVDMLLDEFRDLRDFYAQAAKDGDAVVYSWG